MKLNFKRAGEILGNLFTSHPQISEQDRADLQAALDEDGATALAETEAKVTALEGQLATANTAKEEAEGKLAALQGQKSAADAQVAALTTERDALQTKVAEYEPIKEQLENYRSQVGGVQPEGEAKQPVNGKTAREEEIERLKAEFPISMAFMQ